MQKSINKGTDLKNRIISNLSTTQQVLLYQEDIKTNVNNFKVAAWDIYDNEGATDVRRNENDNPTDDTIEVSNNCEYTKTAVVTKDRKPLFACDVRPEFKVNFAIHPKLYVVLSDMEIHEEFFDATTLSRKPEIIDYEGQQYVTIILDENVSTGKVSVTYKFNTFLIKERQNL